MKEQDKLSKLNQLLETIQNDPTGIFFTGADQIEIGQTEQLLGIPLPPSFKRFLRFSNGASLDHNAITVFGTKTSETLLQVSLVQYRKSMDYLPANLIPFAHLTGTFFCFNTHRENEAEYEVIEWDDETKKVTKEGGLFVGWLTDILQRMGL